MQPLDDKQSGRVRARRTRTRSGSAIHRRHVDRGEAVLLLWVADPRSRQLVNEWARDGGYVVCYRGRESDVVGGDRGRVS